MNDRKLHHPIPKVYCCAVFGRNNFPPSFGKFLSAKKNPRKSIRGLFGSISAFSSIGWWLACLIVPPLLVCSLCNNRAVLEMDRIGSLHGKRPQLFRLCLFCAAARQFFCHEKDSSPNTEGESSCLRKNCPSWDESPVPRRSTLFAVITRNPHTFRPRNKRACGRSYLTSHNPHILNSVRLCWSRS